MLRNQLFPTAASAVERRQLPELALHNAPRELMLGSLMGALLFSAVMGILALSGSLTIGGTNQWGVFIVPLIGAVTSLATPLMVSVPLTSALVLSPVV